MYKVTFLTFYNDFSVGVNVLSRVLLKAGYDVSTIFFKLPAMKEVEWFQPSPGCMESISPFGEIIGSNSDVNKATNQEIDILLNLLTDLNPNILCISSRSPDRDTILQVLPLIRKKFKGIILAGGYGPTFDYQTYLKHVDYVFRGEGENRIIELISKIEKNEPILNFDNIAHCQEGNLVVNKLGTPEELPLEKQTITDNSFYIENDRLYNYEERNSLIKYPDAYSIFFGRGCISTCSYCSAGNWRNLYKGEGLKIGVRRNRRIEDIIDELKEVKKEGITFVNFRDEFLTAGINDLKRFFQLYEREIHIPFWAYLVPQQVLNHPELLEIAVDAGFVDSVVGFQSGSDYINKTYFTRKFSQKVSLEYAHLLAKYNINVKYDFIVFNPAEREEHISETFKLIQALPKHRSYINCSRLLYLPGTPASKLFKEFEDKPLDFEHYYRIALQYLICFVTTPKEFEQVLNNKSLTNSWEKLLAFYKNHLKENDINFPTGTHAIPDSITSHRYKRILEKNKYSDIVVWGRGKYYQTMKHIFDNANIKYHINNSDQIRDLGLNKESLPIFICSPEKRQSKITLLENLPNYSGNIYV